MTDSHKPSSVSEVKSQFTRLISDIEVDKLEQPANRNKEGFFITKNIFLRHGLSEKEHKLWRDKGMHAHMYRALLEQYNNLNENNPLVDIRQVSVLARKDAIIYYPDISWEHLECHAAMIHIGEFRQDHTRDEYSAPKKPLDLITLENLVDFMHEAEPDRPRVLIRESLLRHCLRRKGQIGEKPLPQQLYKTGRLYRNIYIYSMGDKDGGSRYLFHVSQGNG